MFVAAASRAPSLTRTNIVTGLDQVRPLDLAYPAGPGVFDKPGVIAGGQFWRPVVYDGSCPCFKVTDPNWRPHFQ
jgi:hypothetical protein